MFHPVAESLHNDSPREVFRLNDVQYSEFVSSESSENIWMSFTLQNEQPRRITLELERNDDLFSHPILVRNLGADGSVQSVDTIPGGSHLTFRGTARLEQERHQESSTRILAGWARMTFFIRSGEQLGEGAFSIAGVEYHVVTNSNYQRTRSPRDPDISEQGETPYMVAWKESVDASSDRSEELRKRQNTNATCSVSDLDFNQNQLDLATRNDDLRSRQSGGLNSLDLGSLVGSTAGCPTSRQIALLGIATDCSYTAQFNSSDELRQQVLSMVNTASRLYEQSFNVALRVQNLTISDRNCPSSGGSSSTPWNLACSNSVSISDRLQLFTTWRRGLGTDGNAIWSLLSTCNSGSTVGIAWVGTVCSGASGRSQGTPGTNVVIRTRSEWQVLAHEIGHNFGAVHDCTSDCNAGSSERCCPLSQSSCDANGQYIMNPASTTRMTEFSPCTIGTICTAMGRNLIRTTCLSGNENVTTISSGVCGNGIVEPGEECDCGGTEGCGSNSRCCNPTTCRFAAGAACDPSNNRCCTSECQVSGSGNVCRASLGPCDPEEVCDGSSVSCPADVRLPDGQSCGGGSNGTTCASGQCTSRSMQCSVALFNSTSQQGSVSACDSNSCQMNCSPVGSQSSCQVTGADFVDGTPCGSSGTDRLCYSGECSASRNRGGGGASSGSSVSSWISRNRTIFIVIVVVGSLLVLLALWCLVSCLRRKRGRGRKEEASRARMAALQGPVAPGQGPLSAPMSAAPLAPQPSPLSPVGIYPRPAPPPPPSRLSRTTTLTHRYA